MGTLGPAEAINDSAGLVTQVIDGGSVLYLGSTSASYIPIKQMNFDGSGLADVGTQTFYDPESGVIGPDGALYIAANSFSEKRIRRFDIGADTASDWATLPNLVWGPKFRPSDGSLWGVWFSSTSVYRVAPGGGTVTTHTAPHAVSGIAWHDDKMYCTGSHLTRYDPSTNTWTDLIDWAAVTGDPGWVSDMIVLLNGRFYVENWSSTPDAARMWSCLPDGSDVQAEVANGGIPDDVMALTAVGDTHLYAVLFDWSIWRWEAGPSGCTPGVDFSATELVHDASGVYFPWSVIPASISGGDGFLDPAETDGVLAVTENHVLGLTDISTASTFPGANASESTHPYRYPYSDLGCDGVVGAYLGQEAGTGRHKVLLGEQDTIRLLTLGNPTTQTTWATVPHGIWAEQIWLLNGSVWVTTGWEVFFQYDLDGNLLREINNENFTTSAPWIPYDITRLDFADGYLYAGGYSGIFRAKVSDIVDLGGGLSRLHFEALHFHHPSGQGWGGSTRGMAVAGDKVYFSVDLFDADAQIRSVPITGSPTATVEWTNPEAGYQEWGFAVIGNYLYAVSQRDSSGDGKVHRWPYSDCDCVSCPSRQGPANALPSDFYQMNGVSPDGQHFYLLNDHEGTSTYNPALEEWSASTYTLERTIYTFALSASSPQQELGGFGNGQFGGAGCVGAGNWYYYLLQDYDDVNTFDYTWHLYRLSLSGGTPQHLMTWTSTDVGWIESPWYDHVRNVIYFEAQLLNANEMIIRYDVASNTWTTIFDAGQRQNIRKCGVTNDGSFWIIRALNTTYPGLNTSCDFLQYKDGVTTAHPIPLSSSTYPDWVGFGGLPNGHSNGKVVRGAVAFQGAATGPLYWGYYECSPNEGVTVVNPPGPVQAKAWWAGELPIIPADHKCVGGDISWWTSGCQDAKLLTYGTADFGSTGSMWIFTDECPSPCPPWWIGMIGGCGQT